MGYKHSALLALLFAAGVLHAQTPAPEAQIAQAKQIVDTLCFACHAADGNGPLPDYPKLAGQHEDYLYKQLHDFKSWNDAPAVRQDPVMAGMTATLEEEDMRALAVYFSMQTIAPGAAENLETLALGEQIWRGGIAEKGVPACASCHGPAGAGMPAQYPRIGGQYPQYTLAQLKAFREGVRTNDPAEMMRDIALRMTDKEMEAVSDYSAGLH